MTVPPVERLDDHVRELVALGRDHFQRGDYALAAGYFEQLLARGVELPDVLFMLGCVYHHQSEFEAAQRSFTRALELNPGYVEAALNLAIVCNDLGQYERAQEVYGKALQRAREGQREGDGQQAPLDVYTKGKIANLHAGVADAYASLQHHGQAVIEYGRALELCPTFVDLRVKMAHALRDAGQIDLAIAEYRRAVSGAPAYLPARVGLGTALYAGGKLDEAIAQWEEVVKADPQHRAAAMYLKLARSHASQDGKGKSRGPR
jgi:tetratricopeptide (TPR) repeat protein